MKKLLASFLAVAVIALGAVAFVGCDGKGTAYAYDGYKITIVTALDAEGKASETRTFTEREYAIYTLGEGEHTEEEITAEIVANNAELNDNGRIDFETFHNASLTLTKKTADFCVEEKQYGDFKLKNGAKYNLVEKYENLYIEYTEQFGNNFYREYHVATNNSTEKTFVVKMEATNEHYNPTLYGIYFIEYIYKVV